MARAFTITMLYAAALVALASGGAARAEPGGGDSSAPSSIEEALLVAGAKAADFVTEAALLNGARAASALQLVTDADVLAFALNLEYLAGELSIRAGARSSCPTPPSRCDFA